MVVYEMFVCGMVAGDDVIRLRHSSESRPCCAGVQRAMSHVTYVNLILIDSKLSNAAFEIRLS